MSAKKLLTTEQAAAVMGVSLRRVQELLQAGVLKGERYGRNWLIPESACTYRRRRAPKVSRKD
ncbi:MAG: helix-turn-helix domain-containing protein [Armatimonadetes bacterium]|nr:helix-turn-helix domain-containing protein [Armatimonadota bacterium]